MEGDTPFMLGPALRGSRHPAQEDSMTAARLSIRTLADHVGEDLGTSSWLHITQEAVDEFARAVSDFHPVHVDPQFARAAGLQGTIAHGPYLMATGPRSLYELVDMTGDGATLLSGYNRVRFITPVDVGSRVRMAVRLEACHPIPNGSRFTFSWTFEIEGQEKPACVAEVLLAYLPTPGTSGRSEAGAG
jgi:acyl dehydratase